MTTLKFKNVTYKNSALYTSEVVELSAQLLADQLQDYCNGKKSTKADKMTQEFVDKYNIGVEAYGVSAYSFVIVNDTNAMIEEVDGLLDEYEAI